MRTVLNINDGCRSFEIHPEKEPEITGALLSDFRFFLFLWIIRRSEGFENEEGGIAMGNVSKRAQVL